MLEAKGTNGTLAFDGQTILIKRTGINARMLVGGGEKRIPIASVTAVQWKKAGITAGFIQLTVAGGVERRSRPGRQSGDALHDENSVTFHVRQQPAFEPIRAAIEDAIAQHSARQTAAPGAAGSIADELAKLARFATAASSPRGTSRPPRPASSAADSRPTEVPERPSALLQRGAPRRIPRDAVSARTVTAPRPRPRGADQLPFGECRSGQTVIPDRCVGRLRTARVPSRCAPRLTVGSNPTSPTDHEEVAVAGRQELTSHAYRKLRAALLADSDTCHWCGHPGADAADHLIPVSRGGAKLDPDNLAPIHGVNGCMTCGRKCNNEKSDGTRAARLATSVDWYAGP